MLTFTLNWVGVLTLIVTIILPVLTGLVTTRLTSSAKKATVTAVLAALTGFLSELLNALNTGTAYDVGAALLLWLGSFIVSVALYYGFWKPTGVTERAQELPGLVK